ncbi:MAG: DUF4923 family protein [Muribaculaceae bacterium]|nr:DUF4923 family protein [Muribaculaceae bacterium]
MKKLILLAAVMVATIATPSKALDLKSLLGKAAPAVSGVVDGLLTQSDITVSQMVGTWSATGSAVAFQSDNALKKAGGAAVASTIESKLNPYYNKLGLNNSTLTVESDGSFVLKVKGISLKGKIEKRSDGNFDFNFTPFGTFKVGKIKAYVEKPLKGLNVMFDASKLQTLLSSIAKLSGNSLASTVGNLLGSYDGLLVGFAYK